MRWFTFNCILTTSFVVILATKDDHPKQKRDLSLIKNVIKKAIFGTEEGATLPPVVIQNDKNYKIFRIPGFNNVLVKAVPKVPVNVQTAVAQKVETIPQDPTVAMVGSYLGTKTPVETLNALQGVKNLLESGVMSAKREMMQNIVPIMPQPPSIKFISAIRKTESLPVPPVFIESGKVCAGIPTIVQRPVTILPSPPTVPIVPAVPRPIPVRPTPVRPIIKMPTVVETMTPIEMPVPTKYSYKQIHKDGHLTTYTAHDSQNVIVTNSNNPSPLPPFVTYRLLEILKMGSNGVSPVVPVSVMPAPIPRPIQFINFPFRPVRPIPIVNNKYSYKQVHKDGLVNTYSGSGHRGNTVNMIGENIRPALPGIITDRIENVVASTAYSKFPNPVLITGQTAVPNYWFNSMADRYPMFNMRGEVKIKLNNTLNQNIYDSARSPGRFSYQTAHKDGTVTKYSGPNIQVPPKIVPPTYWYNPMVNPHPVFNVREDLKVKVNSTMNQNIYNTVPLGMFYYRTLHKNGSMTTHSISGMGENNVYPTPILPPTYWYNPAVYRYPTFDTRGKVNVNTNVNRNQGGFSYQTVHNDGTATGFSVAENAAIIRPVNLDSTPPAAFHSNRVANIAKENNNSFSYRIIHSDGTETSYGAPLPTLHRDKTPNQTINKKVTNPNVIIEDRVNPHTNYNTDTNERSKGTFSYQTIHYNGNVASHSASEEKSKPVVVKPSTLQLTPHSPALIKNKIENVAKVNGDSFSYRIFHNDGTVKSYGKREEGHDETSNIMKLDTKNTASQTKNVVSQSEHSVNSKQGINPKMDLKTNSGSFSYKIVHTNDSVTTKAGPIELIGAKASNIHQSLNNKGGFVSNQNLHINENINDKGSNNFSYKTVHSDGSVTNYQGNKLLAEKEVEIPRSSSPSTEVHNNIQSNGHVNTNVNFKMNPSTTFSYKAVHSDGSVTSYSKDGIEGNKGTVTTAKSTTYAANNVPVLQTNTLNNANLPLGSFSYKRFQSDGRVTNHAEGGSFAQEKVNVPIETIATTALNTSNRSSGFSYKVIHNSIPTSSVAQTTTQYLPSITSTTRVVPNGNTISLVKPVDSGSFSYKAVHSVGSVTSYSKNGAEGNTHGLATVVREHSNNGRVQQAMDVKGNPNQNIQHVNVPSLINKNIGSFSYKTVHNVGTINSHLEDEPAAAGQKKAEIPAQMTYSLNMNKENIGSPTNSPKLSTIPGFSYKHVSNSNAGQDTYTIPITPISVAAVNPNAVLYSKPVVSSYTYKQISQSTPNNFTVKTGEPVRGDNRVVIEKGKTNAYESQLSNADTVSSGYVYIPPANVNVPLPTKKELKPAMPNDYVYVPPASANAPVPSSFYATKEKTPLSQNEKPLTGLLSENPIVVVDEPMGYSFQQIKTDGSSVNVKGSQSIVAVSLMPQREASSFRGDIPDLK